VKDSKSNPLSFINAQGVEFDIHWHVTPVACNQAADSEFWQRSLAFNLSGATTRRLEPTDSLLHTLIHGVHVFAWNAEPAIRWIPDSILILRKDAADIDWDRIDDFATRYHLSHRLASALEYLHAEMRINIPPAIIEKLQAHPVSLLERLEHRPRKSKKVMISTNADSSASTSLIDKFVQFLRYRHGSSQAQNNANNNSLLAFIVYKHRADSFLEVLRITALNIMSRIRSALKISR